MIFEMKWGLGQVILWLVQEKEHGKEVDGSVSSSAYCDSDNQSDEEVGIHRIIEMMAGRGCGIL